MTTIAGPVRRARTAPPPKTELASIHAQLVGRLRRGYHPDAALAAEDIAQTTWIRLLERLDEFEGRSSLRTFAIGIASNVQRELWSRALRHQRLLARHVATPLYETDGQREDALDLERDKVRLRSALADLDRRERWLVEQRVVEELSYEQILPEFMRRFSNDITTVEGLRSAFFRIKSRLVRSQADRRPE